MTAEDKAKRPRVVVIGGSYAGLASIVNILNLSNGSPQLNYPLKAKDLDTAPQVRPEVVLLDERDGIFHTMGSPLAHTSPQFASEAWKRFADIPMLEQAGVQVVQGRATNLNMNERLLTYHSEGLTPKLLKYDYAIVASGVRRAWPVAPRSLTKEAYLEDVQNHVGDLTKANKIAVVGGGAVGVEIAAEIKVKFPNATVILIHSRSELLTSEPLPQAFKQRALAMAEDLGIQVKLGCRVMSTKSESASDGQNIHRLELSTGEEISCNAVVNTVSRTIASTSFMPPEVLTSDSYIKVLPTLQIESEGPYAEHHFAAGDVVHWSGIKRAGNAFIMGQYVATNLIKSIISKEKQTAGDFEVIPTEDQFHVACPEFEPMMALTVGPEAVIYHKEMGLSWSKEAKDTFVGRGLGIDMCSQLLQFN